MERQLQVPAGSHLLQQLHADRLIDPPPAHTLSARSARVDKKGGRPLQSSQAVDPQTFFHIAIEALGAAAPRAHPHRIDRLQRRRRPLRAIAPLPVLLLVPPRRAASPMARIQRPSATQAPHVCSARVRMELWIGACGGHVDACIVRVPADRAWRVVVCGVEGGEGEGEGAWRERPEEAASGGEGGGGRRRPDVGVSLDDF